MITKHDYVFPLPKGYMMQYTSKEIPEGWLVICEDNREALEEVFPEGNVDAWIDVFYHMAANPAQVILKISEEVVDIGSSDE